VRSALRRALALWALLFGLYAATLGTDAVAGSRYAGEEPHHLLAAESIVSDGDVDLTDEYAERAYASFSPGDLRMHGRATAGRLHEPHGAGFPLLIAPAYALGGPALVELLCAAIAALGFVLATALARVVVPDPWAARGVLIVAVSPPALAYAAAVRPELTAGALLAGAALLALRMRESGRVRDGVAAGFVLAPLPWLGVQYLVLAAPLLAAMVVWTWQRDRGVAGLAAVEVLGVSLLTYVRVNEALYGGFTPFAANGPGESATGAASAGDYAARIPRLLWLWVDREVGLLRWAPVLALAFSGAFLLARSHRSRVARAVAERATAEAAALLALGVGAAAVAVAAFGAPALRGDWFSARHLIAALPCAAVLVAWGLRGFPRVGTALGGVTVLTTAWLLVALWSDDHWVRPETSAPLGPLEKLLPATGE
jgi:hypothetical protein